MTTPPVDSSSDVLPAQRYFTVDEYYRMSDLGILPPDERTELLDGEIMKMAAVSARHAGCVDFLNEWFMARLARRAAVRVQNPVHLNSGSELQPDIQLLKGPVSRYRKVHPVPEDVLLLIEVADTSLIYERDRELQRYAESGIFEVWIVDLVGEQVLAFREPSGGRYRQSLTVGRDGTLWPQAFPELILTVAEVLGRAPVGSIRIPLIY
ncbi:MAG: Uma2 family endonuclease [Dehalococcoidia bacterium]